MAENTKKALPDHDSDPARTPGDGWVGEGGASHLGPATHIASGGEDLDEALSDESDESGDAE
ncbi:hypothetical protein FB468_2392 [Leucobacter komagatae]|uniref:Uncharacterized protein n=1 Tax=Leucobacter komagatae TaxID=55969 RepID=A0A542Y8D6_9MICO|nr:hypothetical protein [Leucobacter komagatae]TQL44335.1 hypothetical protein FB468_2392 [Leucobacter komagatae]